MVDRFDPSAYLLSYEIYALATISVIIYETTIDTHNRSAPVKVPHNLLSSYLIMRIRNLANVSPRSSGCNYSFEIGRNILAFLSL